MSTPTTLLYTEHQAAALLGISRVTLKRDRLRGAIEYTLIGVRTVKYTQAQIDAYLRDRSRRETPPATATPRVRAVGRVPQVSGAAASLALARDIIAGRRRRG